MSPNHRKACSKRGKAPLVRGYQRIRGAYPETVARWFGSHLPHVNVAFLTGRPSGNVVALDEDGPVGTRNLERFPIPRTPTCRSPRGRKFLLRDSTGKLQTVHGLLDGVDLQARGSIVVWAPSLHMTGQRYAEEIPLDDVPIASAPDWLYDLVGQRRQARPAIASRADVTRGVASYEGVAEGQRNVTAASFAGSLLARGVTPEETLVALRAWNQGNQPPLPESEIEAVVKSIAAREASHPRHRRIETLAAGDLPLAGLGWGALLPSDLAIYDALRKVEARRGYQRGARLYVSSRELAEISGVSLRTVMKSLRRLSSQGLIAFRPGLPWGRVRGKRPPHASMVERIRAQMWGKSCASTVKRILPVPRPDDRSTGKH